MQARERLPFIAHGRHSRGRWEAEMPEQRGRNIGRISRKRLKILPTSFTRITLITVSRCDTFSRCCQKQSYLVRLVLRLNLRNPTCSKLE